MFQCNPRFLVPSFYFSVGLVGDGAGNRKSEPHKISTEPWEMKSGAVMDVSMTPQAVAFNSARSSGALGVNCEGSAPCQAEHKGSKLPAQLGNHPGATAPIRPRDL